MRLIHRCLWLITPLAFVCLLGILVLALVIAAFRAYPRGHRVTNGAILTLFFIVTESLLGAGLVTFEWVGANDSQERVYVMAFHLVNTFLLLAVMTLTAWFAGGGGPLRLLGRARVGVPMLAALLGVMVVGSSGAVTALGDTLVLTEGVQPEDSPVVARLSRRGSTTRRSLSRCSFSSASLG